MLYFSGTANPTRPGGKAAAATPSRINAPTRDTGQAPSPNPSGTATPRAHRRHSRRSSTRQVKRTNARRRAPEAACGRTNPTHARPRAPTTRTRQRRAAQAAQTAVGDAQLRILLRDDHVATTASKRFHRTQRRHKALFFGAYPVSFGKTKEMGCKLIILLPSPAPPGRPALRPACSSRRLSRRSTAG